MKPVLSQSPPSGRLPRLIRFGLWLLPITALIVTRESHYAYTLGKSAFFRLLIEALAPLFVALIFLNPRFRPPRTALTWAVLAYAAAVQVATLWSLDPATSWWGTLERMDGAFAVLHFLALFLLLAGVFRLLDDWRICFHLWLASGAVVAAVAIGEYFLQGRVRPGSTLGGPTFLATFALFQIFFGVCILIMEESRGRRVWGAGCVALNLVSLWLTETRGAMIGLAAGLVAVAVLLLVYERGRPRLKLASAVVSLPLLAAPAVLHFARASDLVRRSLVLDRLSAISPRDPTVRTRLILLGVSWNAFKARPIRGYGPELFLVAYGRYCNPEELTYEPGWFDHAHNKLADVAVMDGLIGLVPYVAIFIAAGALLLGALRRGNPQRALIMAAFGMLIAYFVQSLALFDAPVSSVLLYSLLAFIVTLTRTPDSLAAVAAVEKKKKPTPPASKMPGWQRGIVAAAAVVAMACAYANLMAFVQAESAIDLAGDLNDPNEFERGFRQMLAYGAWPTGELVEMAGDDLIGSGELKNPAFASAGRAVTAEMEARAAAHREVDPRFFITLGTLYNEQSPADASLLPRAESALKTAMELAPRWPDSYDALALTDLLAGRTDAALALLRQAVDLNPDNGQARWYYAFILIDHGHEKEGLEQLAAALPHYPYHNPRDLQRVARAYYKAHDLQGAIQVQQELVGLQAASAAQHAALAQLYKESGDPAGALREISIAVRLDGSYAAGAQAFIKSLGIVR